MIDVSQITALFYLLEDPDFEVYLEVRRKLISYGSELIPELENQWELTKSVLVQGRIEEILQKIQLQSLCAKLNFWAKEESYDLLKGVLLACAYQSPKLNTDDLTFTILNIKRETKRNIIGLTPRETILQFNNIFFGDYRFRAVNKERNSPNNYFIHHVISSRKGEIIALSLLYIILAKELSIPISLIKLSNERCLLGYFQSNNSYTNSPIDSKLAPLFFIDPTHKGKIMTTSEVYKKFFKQDYLEWQGFEPLDNKEMLILLFQSLRKYYEELGDKDNKLLEIDYLIKAILN